jgi:hypothetical protein
MKWWSSPYEAIIPAWVEEDESVSVTNPGGSMPFTRKYKGPVTTHGLAQLLLELEDRQVLVTGPDSGGYDWALKDGVEISEKGGTIMVSGHGNDAWWQDGKLHIDQS